MLVHFVIVRFVSATNHKPARLRCQTGDNPPKFYGFHSFNGNNPELQAAEQYIVNLFPNHNKTLVSFGYGLGGDRIFGFDISRG